MSEERKRGGLDIADDAEAQSGGKPDFSAFKPRAQAHPDSVEPAQLSADISGFTTRHAAISAASRPATRNAPRCSPGPDRRTETARHQPYNAAQHRRAPGHQGPLLDPGPCGRRANRRGFFEATPGWVHEWV